MDALIREASKKFRYLTVEYGFRQASEIKSWGTSVVFHGEIWSLYLYYGNRELDFMAEIKYHRFPRKHPKPLWAVLEAMGIDCPSVASATMVDEPHLRKLVTATSKAIAQHREALDSAASPELFRDIERVLNRYARRVRSGRLT